MSVGNNAKDRLQLLRNLPLGRLGSLRHNGPAGLRNPLAKEFMHRQTGCGVRIQAPRYMRLALHSSWFNSIGV